MLFKIGHDFVYIFLSIANQNKLTSFSHVLYLCHWSIKGGFPAKIDQSLVSPLLIISTCFSSYPDMAWYLYCCDDHKYIYVKIFRKKFAINKLAALNSSSSQTGSAIVTTRDHASASF